MRWFLTIQKSGVISFNYTHVLKKKKEKGGCSSFHNDVQSPILPKSSNYDAVHYQDRISGPYRC
jgi:hypothetical protein